MSIRRQLEKDSPGMTYDSSRLSAVRRFFCMGCCMLPLLVLVACGDSAKSDKNFSPATEESLRGKGMFELTDFRTRQYTSEMLVNYIEADHAVSFAGQRARSEMQNVRVRFTSGTMTGTMRSDMGILYDVDIPGEVPVAGIEGVHKGDFILTDADQVHIEYKDSKSHIEVQAPVVYYDSTTTETAFSTWGGNFKAKIRGIQLEGKQFTMSQDWSNIKTRDSVMTMDNATTTGSVQIP